MSTDFEMFPEIIQDTSICLRTASDVARFSFIVQDSLSYLDLEVSKDLETSDYLCGRCRLISFTNFVDTEEKCRLFFAPRRKLLYILNLDLPNGRESSLTEDDQHSFYSMSCCTCPHIGQIILDDDFYAENLSNFVKDALNIGMPIEKILIWIAKSPFSEMELLFPLEYTHIWEFIDCFYPEVTNFELFNVFLKQFNLFDWIGMFEEPEILEHLLYHARLFGNVSWEGEHRFDIQLINNCIYNKCYLNIGPILKFISDALPTVLDYDYYVYRLESNSDDFAEIVIQPGAEELLTWERLGLLMQVIFAYIDSRQNGLHEAASEALRLIWSSVPVACITFGELEFVFGESLRENLIDIHAFYVGAIGESHEHVEPRSLQHLCRTNLRRIFKKNKLWIPDAIGQTGMSSLKAFLNLES